MGLSRQVAKTISRKRRAWRRRYFDGVNSAPFGLLPSACSAVYDEVTSTDIHPTSAGATPHSGESILPRPGKLHMAPLAALSPADFLDSLISLLGAFILGTLIGAERQFRQRSG